MLTTISHLKYDDAFIFLGCLNLALKTESFDVTQFIVLSVYLWTLCMLFLFCHSHKQDIDKSYPVYLDISEADFDYDDQTLITLNFFDASFFLGCLNLSASLTFK